MGYIESNLMDNEEILHTSRKHVILMLGQIVTEIILIGLTLVAFSVASLVFSRYGMTQNIIQMIVYGALGLATTVLVVSGVVDYLKWYNDCVVITNERMMRFEGLFNRHMTESVFNKINDVTLNQTFWGRLLGYGDVTVLTASETGTQEMRNIGKPRDFIQALAEARLRVDDVGQRADNESRSAATKHNVVAQGEDDYQQALRDGENSDQHESRNDDANEAAQISDQANTEADDNDNHRGGDDDDNERAVIAKQLENLYNRGFLDDKEFATKLQQLYGRDV